MSITGSNKQTENHHQLEGRGMERYCLKGTKSSHKYEELTYSMMTIVTIWYYILKSDKESRTI